MEIVRDQEFYHIQRGDRRRPEWLSGVNLFIGRSPNDFFSFFDNFNMSWPSTLEQAQSVLQEYLLLVRETIFEQVRIESFPAHPSRQRCIFLVPPEPEAIKYWWTTLKGPNNRLLRVRVTGKIHKADQGFLHVQTYNVNQWRQRAFNYWSGASGTRMEEEEILFEGFVSVEEEVSPERFGLPA